MKRYPILLPAGTFVAGAVLMAAICFKALTPSEAAPSAGHEEREPEVSNLVRLDPAAIRTAGIRVEEAREMPLGDTLRVPGTVEISPLRSVKITPPVAGKVVRILASRGQSVTAGQALLIIESHELAQAHAEEKNAEAAVHLAQANLQGASAQVDREGARVKQAEAELGQARERLKATQAALERQRELAEAGAFSQAPLFAAQTEMSDAQSELLRAQTELQAHAAALKRVERLFNEQLASKAELEQAQREHRQDELMVARAEARVAIARQSLERERKVYGADLLTKRAVQSAEAEVRSAETEVQKVLQGVAASEQDVRKALKDEQAARTSLSGAEIALTAARDNLRALEGSGHLPGDAARMTVHAPIGGVITDQPVTLGETVERSATLLVLENVESVLVLANVPEKDVSRVRVGQAAEVTVSALPGKVFPGVVQSVAGRLDVKTRALPVRVLVENRGRSLRPEMFAEVLLKGPSDPAPTVPESALEEDGASKYVYVARPGGFERRQVEIGRIAAGLAEVLSGLDAGERVAVEGVFVLKSELRKGALVGHED